MRVVASFEPFPEADLSADAGDLRRLAAVVRLGRGEMAPQVSDPAPYDHALRAVVVRTSTGEVATIEVDRERSTLALVGPPGALELLASNIEALAGDDVPAGHHVHLEWHPDHGWLAEGSFPLVVTRAAARADG